jgi:hypothetical protein
MKIEDADFIRGTGRRPVSWNRQHGLAAPATELFKALDSKRMLNHRLEKRQSHENLWSLS